MSYVQNLSPPYFLTPGLILMYCPSCNLCGSMSRGKISFTSLKGQGHSGKSSVGCTKFVSSILPGTLVLYRNVLPTHVNLCRTMT